MSKLKSIITNNIAFLSIVVIASIIRLLSSFVVFANDKVSFLSFDPFYHMRRIIYTSSNFPNYLKFDSYLNYPFGFEIAWPPLYDQAAAFLAIVLGLGNPSLHTIEVAGALLPPLLGILTFIPLYIVASKVFDKKAALLSAGVFAVIPVHIMVSRAGFVDHHVAEILLSTTAFAFFILSLKSAREIDLSLLDLKRATSKTVATPLIYAVCAGIVLALSIFTWLGSPIFVGLIGVYGIVQFTLDLKEKRSSEYLLISGIITYLAALIMITPVCMDSIRPGFEVSAAFLSWFHVLYVASLLAVFVILGILSHITYSKDLKWWYYPVAVAVLVAVGTFTIRMFSPEFYNNLFSGLGYLGGDGETLGTIIEAKPLFQNANGDFTLNNILNGFMLFFLTAFAAFVFAIRKIIKENYAPEAVFFIVWTIVIASLMILQSRFMYLFSINVAILTGYFMIGIPGVSKLGNWGSTTKSKQKPNKLRQKPNNWQVVTIVVILAILVLPAASRSISLSQNPPVVPHDWQESLVWLESNTPETSYYSNPVEKPEYGVLSWWDYGNWIVYLGHRPAVSNNFQTGVVDAARFFVSTDENESNAILEKRNVRYVITDIDMVRRKFRSIARLAGEDYMNYYTPQINTADFGTQPIMVENDLFMDTTVAKLHGFDGATLGNLRLIYESSSTTTKNSDLKYVKIFEFVRGAKITGFAPPKQTVYADTTVKSNRGREFTYFNTAVANETGWYELTVSYPTVGAPYDTKAFTPYTVAIDNGDIVKVTITEDDIRNGNVFRVDIT